MNNFDVETGKADPWNVSPLSNATSFKGDFKIEYENLSEWRMNAPLGGKAFLIEVQSGKRYSVFNLAGYPPVWQAEGNKAALPLWIVIRGKDEDEGDTIFQRLGVVDADAKTLTIYSKKFRVLHLASFEGDIVGGVDSPIHETTPVNFDIRSEGVESVVELADLVN